MVPEFRKWGRRIYVGQPSHVGWGWGLERWFSNLEYLLLLQRTGIEFPAPM